MLNTTIKNIALFAVFVILVNTRVNAQTFTCELVGASTCVAVGSCPAGTQPLLPDNSTCESYIGNAAACAQLVGPHPCRAIAPWCDTARCPFGCQQETAEGGLCNPAPPSPTPVDNGPAAPPNIPAGGIGSDSIIDITELTNSVFSQSANMMKMKTLGGFVQSLIPYTLAIAGFGLFIFLIIGGFSCLTSAGDPKKLESCKQKITTALVGFVIVFTAYWITQIVDYIFKLGIPFA